MELRAYRVIQKLLKCRDEPYWWEGLEFMEAMDELDELFKDGFCEDGDLCCCGGDALGVKMSCARWVK